MAASKNCVDDYVAIHDGDSMTAPMLGCYCGTDLTAVQSTGNFMYIRFKTDGDTTAKGFKLVIRPGYSGKIAKSLALALGSFRVVVICKEICPMDIFSSVVEDHSYSI